MNRKKKINETLKKRMKKANAKLNKSTKPRYISKAERATLDEEAALVAETADVTSDAIVDSEIESAR
ncbi:DUF2986 domain-containing protein [Photobacterium iliopiscarium]|jgi:hypothetical protein|uniref:DUF2986 domain-containing protein n=1 Tax=Photobacterium iliopiscarium TaxID=56192 RepID=A0A2T3MLB3_9GAMM|nr:DUF2986 domain-containing protein [Photobacterium iliopiscarium]KJG14619.1 hypothetical protein UB38_01495 [Photobacterium iliopiscarium]PST96084.1 DUF2986 domain-containing protein [Photobacterium iliopiscarium]PST99596.1 DUF2986 domain-containing protein [Photobacterium iliopiscarium]PSV82920.1 DUF2986 domain-containing protein [Photobacterium iliopiscarium]PSV97095.1 DUF2986 domain-containing protein [Photobacterium iliopiscarium]